MPRGATDNGGRQRPAAGAGAISAICPCRSGNIAGASAFFPTRPEVAMHIPLPLAFALVAATYGVLAVGTLAY